MKKILLYIVFSICFFLSSKAQMMMEFDLGVIPHQEHFISEQYPVFEFPMILEINFELEDDMQVDIDAYCPEGSFIFLELMNDNSPEIFVGQPLHVQLGNGRYRLKADIMDYISFLEFVFKFTPLDMEEEDVLPLPSVPSTPSQDKNYILSRTYTNESATTFLDQIAYYDGLGRPIQTVQVKVSPEQADLVICQEYDSFGRESNQWLPLIVGSNGVNNGKFNELSRISHLSYTYDKNSYNKPIYEDSPLNRLLEQYGPGEEWHQNGKSVKTAYLTNNSSYPCIYFSAGDKTIINNGNYQDGQLYVREMKDEEGNTSYEFKNKLEQIVLTRQINNSENYDTYYVYDDFGNQRYVLPPTAIDNLSKGLSDESEMMKQFVYIYRYDERNRCIEKRIPGCDWIYYVYDKADRLIFTQDGEQRLKNKLLFTIPDALGRTVLTGICDLNILGILSISDLREYIMKHQIVKATWENTETPYKGYSISLGFTPTNVEILSINYYDNYEFLGKNSFPNYIYQDSKESEGYGEVYGNHEEANKYKNKGLLTGTITTTLGSENKELYTVMYYDYKKQVVQTHSNNHMGGIDQTFTAYNFTKQPIKVHTEQVVNGMTTKELYTYSYDHAGRLVKTRHQLNNEKPVVLAKNTYDETGRLKTNKRGNKLQLETTYDYNVRSWIKDIRESNFIESLKYNHNGNIQSMYWNSGYKDEQYNFTYDNLSRLTKAEYFSYNDHRDAYASDYSYDKMGNIINLQRKGETILSSSGNVTTVGRGIIDQLVYEYTGNQVRKITDKSIAVPYGTGSEDFKDWANLDVEYTYNLDGAMTQDLNKGISKIEYNLLNLPYLMDIKSPVAEARNEYLYSATGTKLRVKQRYNSNYNNAPVIGSEINVSALDKTKTTDYVGNKIYENGNLKRILIDDGYVEYNGYDYQYHFFTKDHLGNNRFVTNLNQMNYFSEFNNYYPFGMAFASYNADTSQPYKYNGKEMDKMHRLNLYDYSARYYDATMIRFTSIDPHAEKYFSWSPYVYCANNPIKFIDPDGREIIYAIISKNPKTGKIMEKTIRLQDLSSKTASAMMQFAATPQGKAFLESFEGNTDRNVKFLFRGPQTIYGNGAFVKNGGEKVDFQDGILNIEISINIKNTNFGEILEILGHEVFLHAVPDLKEIQKLLKKNGTVTKKDLEKIRNRGHQDHKNYSEGKGENSKEFNEYLMWLYIALREDYKVELYEAVINGIRSNNQEAQSGR